MIVHGSSWKKIIQIKAPKKREERILSVELNILSLISHFLFLFNSCPMNKRWLPESIATVYLIIDISYIYGACTWTYMMRSRVSVDWLFTSDNLKIHIFFLSLKPLICVPAKLVDINFPVIPSVVLKIFFWTWAMNFPFQLHAKGLRWGANCLKRAVTSDKY